jgi:hypothetical protein
VVIINVEDPLWPQPAMEDFDSAAVVRANPLAVDDYA